MSRCPTCGHAPPALNDDRLKHALLTATSPGVAEADLEDRVAAVLTTNTVDSIEDAITEAVRP